MNGYYPTEYSFLLQHKCLRYEQHYPHRIFIQVLFINKSTMNFHSAFYRYTIGIMAYK